jgi:hypothetical protein
MNRRLLGLLAGLMLAGPPAAADSAGQRLLDAYPDALARIEGNDLVWRDGTRMPLDDGKGRKPFEDWLERPDIEDMLAQPYPAGAAATAPPRDSDPGRARNAAFFAKLYGDCSKGEVTPHLVEVAWLPRRGGQKVKVTARQGVARRLAAISAELDKLPSTFDLHLIPAAGGYNCRAIAGTARGSAHGYGIAIDLAVKPSHYWRWDKPGPGGALVWRNAMPMEIVRVFEAHGFVWGGRWYHYDTMHFEYRPELVRPVAK